MFSSLLFSRLATVATLATLASAVTFPISRRDASSSIRINMGNSTSDPNDPFNFQNVQGQIYTTTLTINGQAFQVDMDTGSSDLWIDTKGANLTGGTDTGILGAVIYEDLSSAIGNLTLIDVTWGNYTVKDQIFISAPGTNATLGIRDGLLGLGPRALSNISATVHHFQKDSEINANTLLDNVFNLYPDEPNFITFLLTRNVAGVIDGGDFTIGEYVSGYEAIKDTPKLPVVSNRWLSFVDGLKVNGKKVTAKSNGFPGVQVPEGKLTAIFDTGISLDIAPKFFVDAMFKDIEGAEFDDENKLYAVPCDAKVNVSLLVGDLEYPIHPVDLVAPIAVDNGTAICAGSFLASDENTSIGDFQFGDVVLRNLYTLFDFGNWSRPNDDNGPFIQLLNLTDAAKASAEFESMQQLRVQQFLAAHNDSSSDTSSDDNSTSSATATGSSSSPSGTSAISNIQTSEIPLSSATAAVTPTGTASSSTSIASANTGNSKDLSVGGALSDDSTGASAADINNLIRNSYIIIGLLAAVILLLIGVVFVTLLRKMAPSGKNHKYKAIIPPVDEREVYSGPSGRYSD